MPILIIIGCNPSKAPYLQYYLKILQDSQCSYDIVYWNRDNIDESISDNYYTFNYPYSNTCGKLKKIWAHWKFRRFVVNHLKTHHYDKAIVFTIQSVILFSDILCNQFKHTFVFDIRDYSRLYSIGICKLIIDRCLKLSFANCISSPGFKRWLPKDCPYVLSHNIHQSLISDGIGDFTTNINAKIKLLTIGQIRDVEENYALIKSLGNSDKFSLTFIGIGDGINELERRVKEEGYNNVLFKGRYEKKDENRIVAEYDMINAYMPDNMLSNTLMSNRIYLSLILGKPIIVTENSTQADYVKRYNLGVCINNPDNAQDVIISYWDNFDRAKFNQGRIDFLNEVRHDVSVFEKYICEFINNPK